jgi:membrane carboxypeptidase/penicillin-binding protein PbpC
MKKVDRLYAVSKASMAAADKITIKGAKNKKAYKKAVTVKVSAKSAVATFTVNGQAQATNTFRADKNGKYKVVVKSATGKKKTINFCVDKKKPTTNIKNKKTYKKAVKITFKDSISGVKKATLNGRKIKNGKKVKKNGKYTLKIYDKAGNVKKVKFTIKK